jgi:hypothetical protein
MAKLIVRRGMGPEYYEFLNVTAGANRDELIVDRRRAANQGPQDIPERRTPQKWIDEDVIVVSDS